MAKKKARKYYRYEPEMDARIRKVHKVKRRKARRYKRGEETMKEKLKRKVGDNYNGIGLDYVFKSGRYKGHTLKWCIDHDVKYVEYLRNQDYFRFNLKAVLYFVNALDNYNKEKKKRKRQNQEEQKRWNEFFENQRKKAEEEERKRKERKRWQNFNNSYDDILRDFFKRQHKAHEKYQKRYYDSVKSTIIDEILHGKVLGLKGKVTRAGIKKAYHKKLKEWHPDKWERGTSEQKEKAKNNTIGIINAYKFFEKKYVI